MEMKMNRKLIILLVAPIVLAVIAMVVTKSMSSVSSAAPEPDSQAVCMKNLAMLSVALHNYNSVYGSFPPPYTVDKDGKPLHSWRTLLLPFFEQNKLYGQIRPDEPWDSEYNRQFHTIEIPAYRCPCDKEAQGKPYASYDVAVGENTIFPPFDGKLQPVVSFEAIERSNAGTNLTAMLFERKKPIHWMDPTPLRTESLKDEIAWGHGDATLISCPEASVWSISKEVDPHVLVRLFEWKNRTISDDRELKNAIDKSVDVDEIRRINNCGVFFAPANPRFDRERNRQD